MRVLMICLILSLAGCVESNDVSFNFKLNSKNKAEIQKFEKAQKVLLDKCHALKDYRTDIIEREVVIRDAEGYSEKRDFGWADFVEFNIEVKEQPYVIPTRFYSSGHHCLYRVSNNELSTQKTVCAFLCAGDDAEVDSSYSLYIGKSIPPKREPL